MTGTVSGKATRPPLPQCPWCGFIMTIRLHDGWGCGWCGICTCPGGNICKHRRCIRPSHLEPATKGENNRRGQHTILQPDDVREIRRLRAELGLSERALGRRFGIHYSAIHDILSGVNWKDIE